MTVAARMTYVLCPLGQAVANTGTNWRTRAGWELLAINLKHLFGEGNEATPSLEPVDCYPRLRRCMGSVGGERTRRHLNDLLTLSSTMQLGERDAIGRIGEP